MHPPSRGLLKPIIIVAIPLVIVLLTLAGYVEKCLWMRQLNYAGIFWTLLSVQCGMFASAFVLTFLYLWINLRLAARNSAAFRRGGLLEGTAIMSTDDPVAQTSIDLSYKLLNLVVLAVSAGVALFFAAGVYTKWDTYLRFRYGGSFGLSDPLFKVDVGYYLFRLPFYEVLQSSLMLLTVLALAVVLLIYVFFGLLRLSGGHNTGAGGNVIRHLSVLLYFSSKL